MVNKVTLIGNLGKDPEVRHLDSGIMVASVSLATGENYQDKNGEWQKLTEWHNIVLWRDLADRAEKQLKKGMLVYVEGKISYRKYNDKDGNERYTTDIVASTFRLLEKREGGGNFEQRNFPTADAAPPTRSATPAPPMNTGADASAPAGGDDLPF
ncbi:MAG: single-stranded DNA-binding protein [Saprospiraceae bacterium]